MSELTWREAAVLLAKLHGVCLLQGWSEYARALELAETRMSILEGVEATMEELQKRIASLEFVVLQMEMPYGGES